MVILSDSKEFLHKIRADISIYLNDNLKLQLKFNYQVFPVDSRGIDFLGYVFYHTHTKLRKSIKKNLFHKVTRLNKIKAKDRVDCNKSLSPWWGWLKYCNSIALQCKIYKTLKYDYRFPNQKCKL